MQTAIERIYMPAMPPLWLLARLDRWLERRRSRRSLRQLLERDDHILRDLGYSRAELHEQLQGLERSPATCASAAQDEKRLGDVPSR
jgi:uncharacterized protein YjiS (DUF1127 family)